MCQWAPGDAGKPEEHTFHDDPQAHELAKENQRELAAQAAALEAAAKEVCSGCAQGLELNGSNQHNFYAFGWQNCAAIPIRALITPDQRTALQAALDAATKDAVAHIALLEGALKTVHLAGTFGSTNQEVANRIAELEYTHIQSKQYISHAQEREHALNEARAALDAARLPLIEALEPDYSKPLEVIWLCRPCHLKQHGKESRISQTKEQPRQTCIGNDPTCPCNDGDSCNYRGENPFPVREAKEQHP